MKRLMVVTALTFAALTTPTWAQAPAEHDSHHPSDSAKSEPAPTNPPPTASQPGMNAPQGGMGGMPMMDMMKGMMSNMPMMNMMNMMEMMQATKMMSSGMGGIVTIDRVEGRIAFLRTELKITDAQASAWNAFADALRANAKKLSEVRASMMGKSGDAVSTMADRLDQQEQWLLARLEGTRTMKSAFTKLNEVLSDDQKKTANDLLAPHMGMGMMAMMPSQMQPGQMQPGQMGPGQIQPGQMGPGKMQPGQMQPPRTGN
jgi:LTXXQ motif family protein